MTRAPASVRGSHRRTVFAAGCLVLLLLALGTVALLLGKASLTPAEVVDTIIGRGSPLSGFVIGELRLPRILTAVVVGAALGVSGALFQTTLHNPLASPDIIGITASASVVGVIGLLAFGLSGFSLGLVVIAGSLVAAAVMYLLSWRGGLSAYRLVLVGIGVAAISAGIVSFVLSRTDIRDAQVALVWVTGSLNNSTWEALVPTALLAGALVIPVVVLVRALRALELGDDTAAALGVPVERTRLGIIVCAVALAALAVSIGGPIAFVALAAGQIARRLVRGGGSAVLLSGLVGAALLLAADLVAQFAWPPTALPTGVVTGLVGAPLLIWLLVRTNRGSR